MTGDTGLIYFPLFGWIRNLAPKRGSDEEKGNSYNFSWFSICNIVYECSKG